MRRALQPWRARLLNGFLPRLRQLHRRDLSTEAIRDPTNTVQVYVSRVTDPYLNLAFEDHIFRNFDPASTRVLLLYVNRPCIVIGRNQNPWLEANIPLLRQGLRDGGASELGGHGSPE